MSTLFETVTSGRSKRSTAGNRMRELLEKAHQQNKDEMFAEEEEDEEFVAPDDVRDVFLDEFADTDDEIELDEDEIERDERREERRKTKGKNKVIFNPLVKTRPSTSTTAAPTLTDSDLNHLRQLDPSLDPNAMAPSTLVLTLRKQRREEKRLGRNEARRSTMRASTLRSEQEVIERERAEKETRTLLAAQGKGKGRRAQHEVGGEVRGLRPMSQAELIAEALEEEERNKEKLKDWLKKEEEKRELRRVGRKRVKGPRWTWVSRTVAGKLVEVLREEEGKRGGLQQVAVMEDERREEVGITEKEKEEKKAQGEGIVRDKEGEDGEEVKRVDCENDETEFDDLKKEQVPEVSKEIPKTSKSGSTSCQPDSNIESNKTTPTDVVEPMTSNTQPTVSIIDVGVPTELTQSVLTDTSNSEPSLRTDIPTKTSISSSTPSNSSQPASTDAPITAPSVSILSITGQNPLVVSDDIPTTTQNVPQTNVVTSTSTINPFSTSVPLSNPLDPNTSSNTINSTQNVPFSSCGPTSEPTLTTQVSPTSQTSEVKSGLPTTILTAPSGSAAEASTVTAVNSTTTTTTKAPVTAEGEGDTGLYTRNYIILSQVPGGLPAEIKLILGDHVEWSEVKAVPVRNRPINRKPQICPLNGRPSPYRHPLTRIPYDNVQSYHILNALARCATLDIDSAVAAARVSSGSGGSKGAEQQGEGDMNGEGRSGRLEWKLNKREGFVWDQDGFWVGGAGDIGADGVEEVDGWYEPEEVEVEEKMVFIDEGNEEGAGAAVNVREVEDEDVNDGVEEDEEEEEDGSEQLTKGKGKGKKKQKEGTTTKSTNKGKSVSSTTNKSKSKPKATKSKAKSGKNSKGGASVKVSEAAKKKAVKTKTLVKTATNTMTESKIKVKAKATTKQIGSNVKGQGKIALAMNGQGKGKGRGKTVVDVKEEQDEEEEERGEAEDEDEDEDKDEAKGEEEEKKEEELVLVPPKKKARTKK